MNVRIWNLVGIVVLAGLLTCLAQVPRKVTSTSISLSNCPDGHKELRDVPIRYGLQYISTNGREKDLEDLKYVLGGCVLRDDSPTTMVICATCRFRYIGEDNWYKSGTNFGAFGIPFSAVMTNLLAFFQTTNSVYFTQQVRTNRVDMENIQFRCERDAGQLTSQVAAFMDDHKIPKRTSRYPHEIFLGVDHSLRVHQVWILPDQGKHYLSYSIFPKERLTLLESEGRQLEKKQIPISSDANDAN